MRSAKTIRRVLQAAALAASAAALAGCWLPAGGRMNLSSLPDASPSAPPPGPSLFGGGAAGAPAPASQAPAAKPPAAASGLREAQEAAQRSAAAQASIEAVRPKAAPRIQTDLGVKPAPQPGLRRPAPSPGAKFRQPGPIPGSLGNPAVPSAAGGFILPSPGARR